MMKGTVLTLIVGLGLTSLAPAIQWGGWVLSGVFALLLVKLWQTDPHTTNRQLTALNKELKERVGTLEANEAALQARDLKQSEELSELKDQIRELRDAFDNTAAMVGRLQDELKEEKLKRYDQYQQLIKERAKHGNL